MSGASGMPQTWRIDSERSGFPTVDGSVRAGRLTSGFGRENSPTTSAMTATIATAPATTAMSHGIRFRAVRSRRVLPTSLGASVPLDGATDSAGGAAGSSAIAAGSSTEGAGARGDHRFRSRPKRSPPCR